MSDLKNALENLTTISPVTVTSSGSQTILTGDLIDVEFTLDPGSLSLMSSSGPDIITKLTSGVAPFRNERQVISCNAQGGSVNLGYNNKNTLLAYSATIQDVEDSLRTLLATELSIVDVSGTGILCSTSGSKLFIDVVGTVGDLPAVEIVDSTFSSGSIIIYGDGEEGYGAFNGIKPLFGSFTLSFNGATSNAIDVDATAEELKADLESLPGIGSISVTKSEIGLCTNDSGSNLLNQKTCGSNVWIVTFGGDGIGCHPTLSLIHI